MDSSVYQSRGGYINHPFPCVPLVDTASDPALKATDATAAASTEASDKQHKKASPPPTPHPLVSTTTTTISTAYPLYPTMSLAFIPSLCTWPGSTSTWSGTLTSMNHMNLCLDHASVMPDHRHNTARTFNPDNEIAQCFPSQHWLLILHAITFVSIISPSTTALHLHKSKDNCFNPLTFN